LEQDQNDKLGLDDVRDLAHVYREGRKEAIKALKPKWYSESSGIPELMAMVATEGKFLASTMACSTALHTRLTEKGELFGRHKNAQRYWTQLQVVARVRNIKPFLMWSLKHPEASRDVKFLERRGLHRTNALDYVFGSISSAFIGSLNSQLAVIITNSLSTCIARWLQFHTLARAAWTWLSSSVSIYLSICLTQSAFTRKLYTF